MFKCPNCGGKVVFDIETQDLFCDYCKSHIAIDKYAYENKAETVDLKVYSCKNCGAELITPDESIVGYCSYCGTESVIDAEMTETNTPKRIIPFKITKDECKKKYKEKTKKLLFLPKEFKDERYIDNFKGVYIPYKQYDIRFAKSSVIKAVQTTESGNRVTESQCDVDFSPDRNESMSLTYDMSSSFDDSIARKIDDFNAKDEIDFDSAYLAGFYADRENVDANKYETECIDDAALDIKQEITDTLRRQNMTAKDAVTIDTVKERFEPAIEGSRTKLFPVWFYTWRKKDRVAYIVANGQNGKIAADLPVNTKTYLLLALVIAVGIFALLNLFLTMTARSAMTVCLAILAIVTVAYSDEIKEIFYKENHVEDIGYSGNERKISEAQLEKIRRSEIKGIGTTKTGIGTMILLVIAIMIAGSVFAGGFETFLHRTWDVLICFAVIYLNFTGSIKRSIYIDEKNYAMSIVLAIVSAVLSVLIAMFNPPADYYYYFVCALCALSALLSSLVIILCYNRRVTRKIPSFFDRKGGNDK